MIEQCPVNLECTVVHSLDLGSHSLIIGKIEETYVSDSCLTDGKPDADKIKPLIYTIGEPSYYRAFGKVVAKAFNAGKELRDGK
jgi:flavin reductase (DIM6/NTAB) family NADH-FMN oxidoreductase RutF